MYVCICAGLNERKVRAAVEAGARSPASVLSHHGETVRCGKCVSMIRELVSECARDCRNCPNAELEATLGSLVANDDGAAVNTAAGAAVEDVAAYGVAAE